MGVVAPYLILDSPDGLRRSANTFVATGRKPSGALPHHAGETPVPPEVQAN